MKKSVILFAVMAVLAAGSIIYGWIFVNSQVGGATLTEETITGRRDAADGLVAGFRADSGDDLHWINVFDYSTNQTKSSFQRGELAKTTDASVYKDFRFTGWSTVPYSTQLKDDGLSGLQNKEIHAFYDEIQQLVMKSGKPETGKIRLRDYLDYYPVSFRFQFGNKIYNSNNMLTGLKVYDKKGMLSPENRAVYDEEINLYTAFYQFFKIPVIDNEYQEYTVSKVEEYNPENALGYQTNIKTSLGEGEDFYTFDPIIVIQEENILDGKNWCHPDLSGGLTYEENGSAGDSAGSDASYIGKSASAYNRKNRMLFIVNNRTAKGFSIDISQIAGGYGVYELPVEASATATIRKGRRSSTVPNPKPACSEMKMVYSLDPEAEYVEMSLSGDHRYVAVFSVKHGDYFAELIDADTWTSAGETEVFPASEKMTYAWGEDGSLALTNHNGYIAIFIRTGNENRPYDLLYSGKTPYDFDETFFDTEMVLKENSYAKYQCRIDTGLAVAAEDGKAALVQSMPTGNYEFGIRNAALVCAVIDKTGVVYTGRLKSSITDLEYDMSTAEIKALKSLSGRAADLVITPVKNENRVRWKSSHAP